MTSTETLTDFYRHKLAVLPDNLVQDVGHFNVFRLQDCTQPGAAPVRYCRRDFYKISLSAGTSIVHYADKSMEVQGPALMFFNPRVPYTWEPVSGTEAGVFCIFREAFVTETMRCRLTQLPMFAPGGKPCYFLSLEQAQHAAQVFEKMLVEINSDYRYKYELLRHYVDELLHLALRLEPSETLYDHPDANARIAAVFGELLERQFPIDATTRRFTLRSARDYADQLAVHVNHLNRAVRQTTGKTTTAHIAARLTQEAISLLKHTDWSIAEVGYRLGFEEPAHFSSFFKKQTQRPPSAYRVV